MLIKIDEIKSILNPYFLVFIFSVGMFTWVVDVAKLKKSGFKRDTKIARYISLGYIIMAPAIYILLFILGGE